jgi:tetratricopeptide (TPR) repeat protein
LAEPETPRRGFQFEVDPDRIEESLRALRKRIADSFTAGRYTKVRLSFRGKQLGPDIPLAILLAGEGVAFWFTGPLMAVLVNLGAKAVLEVEFLHEADELVQEGLSAYLDGETALAEQKYRQALERRSDDPAALYNLGILLKVTGRDEEALSLLRKAAMGPEGNPDVTRAAEALDRLTAAKKRL